MPAPLRSRLLLCLALALLAAAAVAGIRQAVAVLPFPDQLDYGEGIVWQQARLIGTPHLYSDINTYPFIVFNYPPLYHALANLISALGISWLAAARLISVLSSFAAAALLGGFVFAATRPAGPGWRSPANAPALFAAILAAAMVLATPPIPEWARLARVDLLALALELLGMLLGLHALRRPGLLLPAVLVFALAGFAKQTTITGAAATLAVTWLHHPRATLRALLLGLAATILAFAAITLLTHGGFPQHIIGYNVNRFSLAQAMRTLLGLGPLQRYPLYVAAAAVSAAAILFVLGRHGPRRMPPGPLIALLYTLLGTLSLLTLGKSGAASNYFLSWICGVIMLIAIGLATLGRLAGLGPRGRLYFTAALMLLGAQAAASQAARSAWLTSATLPPGYQELLAMVRAAPAPVFSDDMVLLMQAGRDVPWEPAIISELTAMHVFDEARVLALIDSHRLAFAVITECARAATRPSGICWPADRYSPAVIAAFERNYPVATHLAGRLVLQPR